MYFFIKNIGIIICCIYIYIKLLHLKPNKYFFAKSSIFSVLLSLLSIFNEINIPYFTIPFLIISITLYLHLAVKIKLSTSITTTTISFALSYVFLIISSMVICFLFFNFYGTQTYIYIQILSCILQLIITPLLFRIKRFRNGMPFLHNEIYAFSGTLISFLILLMFLSIRIMKEYNLNTFFVIPFILICFFAFLIYHYWQQNLTKTYRDKLNERNLEDLNKTIASQSERIEMLEQENARLAKIIHKDNKLIPAMEYAVRTFIQSNSVATKDKIGTGEKLLEELSTLSSERKGILHQQNMNCQQLDLTNVASIDHLLNYFQGKANENNIEFQSIISCDVQYLVEHIISENDLKTLLADLLENARIATKYNNGRYILLSMSIVSNTYTISVFDSGIPFTADVIEKWGLEQITTHADDEGSGIGMLTTYEILKKYRANFIIHELSKDNRTYTKEITVSFNKCNQYILQTNRPEEELIKLSKRADLQIIRQ